MIPHFPDFKKLETYDKEEIEKLVKNFPPYSDYNFVSMLSWDTTEKVKISTLNDNLVILFKDYLLETFFYTFIGINKVYDTIITLISDAEKIGIDTTLRLIPEDIINNIERKDNLIIKEDRNNFDYILSIEDLIEFKGNRGKKNLLNRFKKLYEKQSRTELINLSDSEIKKQVLSLFYKWEKAKGNSREETKNELMAIKKVLDNDHNLDLKTIGLFIDNRLVGFSINEVVHDNHGMIHFEKADISYIGIFQYLKHLSAKYLGGQGLKHINYQQDLGIEGLRKAKMSYSPVKFLKKYLISFKNN